MALAREATKVVRLFVLRRLEEPLERVCRAGCHFLISIVCVAVVVGIKLSLLRLSAFLVGDLIRMLLAERCRLIRVLVLKPSLKTGGTGAKYMRYRVQKLVA